MLRFSEQGDILMNYATNKYLVEIIKSNSQEYWYTDRIGEKFSVYKWAYDDDRDGYSVTDNEELKSYCLDYDDVKIVEELENDHHLYQFMLEMQEKEKNAL